MPNANTPLTRLHNMKMQLWGTVATIALISGFSTSFAGENSFAREPLEAPRPLKIVSLPKTISVAKFLAIAPVEAPRPVIKAEDTQLAEATTVTKSDDVPESLPSSGEKKPATEMPNSREARATVSSFEVAEPKVDPFTKNLNDAIDITSRRILSADTHTPWQIGHGVLALRHDYEVRVNGEKVNAIDWISHNPTYDGEPWFYLTRYGARTHPFSVPYAFEGHPNQFLAFLALSKLPKDHKFYISGRTVTLQDFINNAKMSIDEREETTWTLWFFAYYVDLDDRWFSAQRKAWNIERMVQVEMREPVTKKACGGNHSLFAIASARNAYLQKGQRLYGTWLQAHYYLNRHIELARRLQNNDGTFSSNYYKGRGFTRDPSKRVSTSGHTLEFLMMAVPEEQLQQEWIRNAVSAVSKDLLEHKYTPLEVGGMYHALHSLIIYRERTQNKSAAPNERLPLARRNSR
ncbi:hypothetical protein [Calycomorphotria hydatis]|uniref:Uncharacterized protein n=1 Tax=Calycomorphotria hydatis TaxID=2528027 RepID=A0A517T901_9PLAN|nr:hypothetical protein [Calycomorphotria hydatis]QDT64843.1 hypothetical protein V22_20860 [Calycomorphotria hydatis]